MNSKPTNEIYLEFKTVGSSQQVSAIDPVSGIEVSVTGPANASRDKITGIAVAKLKRRLERDELEKNSDATQKKGILL